MIKLKKPDMDLVDFLDECERIDVITLDELRKMEEEAYKQGIFGNSFVHLFINEEPGVAEYLNNGECFFKTGEDLCDYKLDDPEFYTYIEIEKEPGSGKYTAYNAWRDDELVFSDDPDALEWRGQFDGEAIAKAFMLNGGSANSPWAGLEVIYMIDEMDEETLKSWPEMYSD